VSPMLAISNLKISIEGKPIVKGLDLKVKPGEIHVIMGPNGSGKSTLAYALSGHPAYTIESGKEPSKTQTTKQKHTVPTVLFNGDDLLAMSPDERAKAGLFLAFQYPVSIEGVTVSSFLRLAYQAIYPDDRMPLFKFRKKLKTHAKELGIDESFLGRYLNDGFSGGEKKRVEILQMRVLRPKLAICDETDSGLDIDALQVVAQGIQQSVDEYKMGVVVITHYQRILQYLKVDKVHVMKNGKIVKSGGMELVEQLEKTGYSSIS
jgi:Fe-S cluster assembly ATP-binding protein